MRQPAAEPAMYVCLFSGSISLASVDDLLDLSCPLSSNAGSLQADVAQE